MKSSMTNNLNADNFTSKMINFTVKYNLKSIMESVI